jgi:hypothetical protein
MITTILSNAAGFYSQLFFLLNHYLYAKNNNLSFIVKSDKWLFKYKNGWEDYFKNVDVKINNKHDFNNSSFGHHQEIFKFTIKEYKNAIKEVYVYNDTINEKIKKVKEELCLNDNYDAIFIRRGDKLSGESNFINTEKYIDILLLKNLLLFFLNHLIIVFKFFDFIIHLQYIFHYSYLKNLLFFYLSIRKC